jgi:hypothetical protein
MPVRRRRRDAMPTASGVERGQRKDRDRDRDCHWQRQRRTAGDPATPPVDATLGQRYELRLDGIQVIDRGHCHVSVN